MRSQALALQALRVFRIVKLTKHLTGLKALTARAFGSPAGVGYALLVTIGFVCFMAFFGNELFSAELRFARARNDFQFFLSAMKTMLEFMLGDRYFENLEVAWASGSFVGIFFFLAYYYVANFLVLRMFIALILENFEYDDDTKVHMQIMLYQRAQILMNDLIDGHAREISLEEQFQRLRKQDLDENRLKRHSNAWAQIVRDRANERGEGGGGQHKDPDAGLLWNVLIDAAARKEDELAKEEKEATGWMLKLWQAQQWLRKLTYDIVENPFVDFVVLIAVVFSVVLVQIDTKQAPVFAPDVRWLIDMSLLGFFLVETGLKMFAYGVFVQVASPASEAVGVSCL